jgi:hypothetical protein
MTGQNSENAIPGMDVNQPSVARVYDYFLGGTNNFPADRVMAEEMLRLQPHARQEVRHNRAFLVRAVRYLAGQAGIRQFLDIGAGLPTRENVHEIAQAVSADAHVVYVDNDPTVVHHAHALLRDRDGVAVVQEDVRNPESILQHPVTNEVLDLSKPTALLLVAVLHFVPDADHPHDLVTRYVDQLAPGSYLVLTHTSPPPVQTAEADEAVSFYHATPAGSLNLRTPAQIQAFLDGLQLLDPGIVHTGLWRPTSAEPVDVTKGGFVGGVAYKPTR